MFVLGCALLTTALGHVFILAIPIPLYARLLVCAAWLWRCCRDVYGQIAAYACVRGIHLHPSGRAHAVAADGSHVSLVVTPGSVVLRRVAWLRLELANGSHYGELLTGRADACDAWHRLQLIWRQRNAAFGRYE